MGLTFPSVSSGIIGILGLARERNAEETRRGSSFRARPRSSVDLHQVDSPVNETTESHRDSRELRGIENPENFINRRLRRRKHPNHGRFPFVLAAIFSPFSPRVSLLGRSSTALSPPEFVLFKGLSYRRMHENIIYFEHSAHAHLSNSTPTILLASSGKKTTPTTTTLVSR